MSIEELLNLDLKDKDIIIIGRPGAGKTHISRLIAKLNGQQVVSTDAYMQYGFEESLYVLIDDLEARTCPLVVEGMLGYRLLRKGLQSAEDIFKPQVVIELEISAKKQREVYEAERDPKKLKYMQSFAMACTKVLNDYYKLLETAEFKPEIFTVENNW